MTGQNVVDQARVNLKDTGTSQRWTDPEMLTHINRAQRDVFAKRPDSTISGSTVTFPAVADLTALSGTLSVSDRFLGAMLAHVLVSCYLKDAGDADNAARANACLNMFEKLVMEA